MKSANRKKNFHIPLPAEIHEELRQAAQITHRPATQIARDAIEHWLKELKKSTLRKEIQAYAQEQAGTPFDLDLDLEAASIDHLTKKGID